MIEINDSNHFDSQIKSAGEKLVVVDFGATWCGPCRAVAPRFRHLAETYGTKGEALFMKVDVDDCMDLAMTLGITALPTFVFYKNQESVDRVQGSKIELVEEKIKHHLSDEDLSKKLSKVSIDSKKSAKSQVSLDEATNEGATATPPHPKGSCPVPASSSDAGTFCLCVKKTKGKK